jgi:hypothetical protein
MLFSWPLTIFYPRGEIMDKWVFSKDPQGKYLWRRKAVTGKIVGISSVTFLTKEECAADAKKNGWVK